MHKSSIHFSTAKPTSEAHNLRQTVLDYNFPTLKKNNVSFVSQSIEDRLTEIKRHCKATSGRKLQKNAEPIKEAVVNLRPDTSMEDLKNLADEIKAKFNVECFQIHIHRDEGHKDDNGNIVINDHAHMLFDWQNKEKGTTMKLNKVHMSQMQTLVANSLKMERGELRVNSNRERLEPLEYKTMKAAEQLKRLQEQNKILEQKKNTLREDIANNTAKADEVRARIAKLKAERGAADAVETQGSTETTLKRIIYLSAEDFEKEERTLLKFDENSLSGAVKELEHEVKRYEASLRNEKRASPDEG